MKKKQSFYPVERFQRQGKTQCSKWFHTSPLISVIYYTAPIQTLVERSSAFFKALLQWVFFFFFSDSNRVFLTLVSICTVHSCNFRGTNLQSKLFDADTVATTPVNNSALLCFAFCLSLVLSFFFCRVNKHHFEWFLTILGWGCVVRLSLPLLLLELVRAARFNRWALGGMWCSRLRSSLQAISAIYLSITQSLKKNTAPCLYSKRCLINIINSSAYPYPRPTFTPRVLFPLHLNPFIALSSPLSHSLSLSRLLQLYPFPPGKKGLYE